MKTIVTHHSPDVDAICSVWLIKKFLPDFHEARLVFVPAGYTLDNQPVDTNPDIIHVDTGMGRFDHHQTNKNICAAAKVLAFLTKEKLIKKNQLKAVSRMVKIVNEIDHFAQVSWPQSQNDRYEFFIEAIVDGLRLIYSSEDEKIIKLGLPIFEAIFHQFLNKIWAEEIIKNKSLKFRSCWGKTLAVLTTNDETIHLAQKMGYNLVIRKDPRKNYVRIKGRPDKKINLTKLYQVLKKHDQQANWYLHKSRRMILNGSAKNPSMKPTNLSLEEIVKIIKSIKL